MIIQTEDSVYKLEIKNQTFSLERLGYRGEKPSDSYWLPMGGIATGNKMKIDGYALTLYDGNEIAFIVQKIRSLH